MTFPLRSVYSMRRARVVHDPNSMSSFVMIRSVTQFPSALVFSSSSHTSSGRKSQEAAAAAAGMSVRTARDRVEAEPIGDLNVKVLRNAIRANNVVRLATD